MLHHHTQTLQLIWLTVPGSWNSLPFALRLSLVLVLNLSGRSLLHAEDEQSVSAVPAAAEQLVPALEWSAATVASALYECHCSNKIILIGLITHSGVGLPWLLTICSF
ncbi:hypothetical protein DY000_02018223 [Brassica cretica]|uniref:Secreted protein n=1 Tax=Brassica cretica TaxID=69181 RepID=A0ABQ7D149_BRACR|nr:hypothetical protein DY000_02018223 [Brassica cretica]